MARRRPPKPVDYNDLYHYFSRVSHGTEHSSCDVDPDGTVTWSTAVDTKCGIELHRPPFHTYPYEATPVNTLTFAHTGGDGCHFGFLTTVGEWSENCPVVMTHPPADRNVVVAGSLFEFLRLGLRTGFFALEELAYYDEPFDGGHPFVVEHLTSRRKSFWLDGVDVDALARLAQRFGLTRLSRIGPRLAVLNRRYLPQLIPK